MFYFINQFILTIILFSNCGQTVFNDKDVINDSNFFPQNNQGIKGITKVLITKVLDQFQ